MVVQRILIGVALVLFLAQTTLVLQDPGFVGFFESANLNAATRLMFLDLVMALVLIAVWMWKDAARRGHTALSYLAVTLLLGSAGPLLYLLRRSWNTLGRHTDESIHRRGVGGHRAAVGRRSAPIRP